MVYVITCKNGYPPANKFEIKAYDSFDASWNLNKIVTKLNKVYFCTVAEDPAEAMINFWKAYMFGIEEGVG